MHRPQAHSVPRPMAQKSLKQDPLFDEVYKTPILFERWVKSGCSAFADLDSPQHPQHEGDTRQAGMPFIARCGRPARHAVNPLMCPCARPGLLVIQCSSAVIPSLGKQCNAVAGGEQQQQQLQEEQDQAQSGGPAAPCTQAAPAPSPAWQLPVSFPWGGALLLPAPTAATPGSADPPPRRCSCQGSPNCSGRHLRGKICGVQGGGDGRVGQQPELIDN